jgi:TPR repeat protein
MAPPSYDVFISYQRRDRQRAGRVRRWLQTLGWSVYWDGLFPAGENYQDHLKPALEHSRCILVLWTPHSVKSEFVADEASYGLRREVLVSVVVGEVELPDFARGVQYITWPRWGNPSPRALTELVEAIARKHGEAAPSLGTPRLPRTTWSATRIVSAAWVALAIAATVAAAALVGANLQRARPSHTDALVAVVEPVAPVPAALEPQAIDAGRERLVDKSDPASGTAVAGLAPSATKRGGSHCPTSAIEQARALAQQALIDGRQADAERELARACDCNDALGCFRLGKLLHHGDGTQGWDHPRALEAYRRACELGHGGACEGAGRLYLDHQVGSVDPSVMVKLFRRGCEQGAGDACAQVGLFYTQGFGPGFDAAQAHAYYARACELRSGQGCLLLAGDTKESDPKLATELFEKACELNNADGCHQAGQRQKAAPGADAASKAARLLGRACELGRSVDCQEGG